jgi:hypothetical protein
MISELIRGGLWRPRSGITMSTASIPTSNGSNPWPEPMEDIYGVNVENSRG